MVVLTLLRNYFHDKNYSKLELGVHKRNNEDFVYLSLTQSDWGKDSFVRKNKFNMLLYLLNKHIKSFACFLEQCWTRTPIFYLLNLISITQSSEYVFHQYPLKIDLLLYFYCVRFVGIQHDLQWCDCHFVYILFCYVKS